MKNKTIHFFKEQVTFRLLKQEKLSAWISSAFKEYKYKPADVSYIFCSDKYLLKLNKDYLNHNYLTDIITFDNSTVKKSVEADIFISVDRIAANAKKFNTTFNDELHRVMIHGALHLVGYTDKDEKSAIKMRKAEDEWLKKRRF